MDLKYGTVKKFLNSDTDPGFPVARLLSITQEARCDLLSTSFSKDTDQKWWDTPLQTIRAPNAREPLGVLSQGYQRKSFLQLTSWYDPRSSEYPHVIIATQSRPINLIRRIGALQHAPRIASRFYEKFLKCSLFRRRLHPQRLNVTYTKGVEDMV